MQKVVWSLFDGSGFMAYQYALNGWKVFCFNADTADHGQYEYRREHPNITYVNCWIDDSFVAFVAKAGIPKPNIIFAFPSCTNLTVAGAKHTRTKSELMESIDNAKMVERIGNLFSCRWMVENPVGKMSTLWRKPDYYFDPYEYRQYLDKDEGSYHPKMPTQNAYTKKTCLWVSKDFTMPPKAPVPHIGCFWGWKYLGGKSERTKQLRSLTPEGFARAVYYHNN